jgi:hypothetical protein
MATDSNGARGGTGGRRRARGILLRPRAVFRSLLLAASVFTVAALTGALLSGAAPAATGEPAGDPVPAGPVSAPAPPSDPVPTETFARSMIYTGSAGLAVSIAGLVMVGWRRRLW